MNAPAFGRDVAPLGREVGATGFARGAPRGSGTSFFTPIGIPSKISWILLKVITWGML
jgi:hypothetical protein